MSKHIAFPGTGVVESAARKNVEIENKSLVDQADRVNVWV
jgi:hypothetical protein